jgi:ribonuclease P protein component
MPGARAVVSGLVLNAVWGRACLVPMERLKQRADFVAAAAGTKVAAAAFVLQTRERGDARPPRVGFTVSKKVGNAVERNRVRRRLREVVRLTAAEWMRAGSDYVLIGRRSALTMPFERLRAEFAGAFDRLYKTGRTASRSSAERTAHPRIAQQKVRSSNDQKAS